MGPFFVIMQGITLVTVPEAARVLRHSPRHLRIFCVVLAAGLALAAGSGRAGADTRSPAWAAPYAACQPRPPLVSRTRPRKTCGDPGR
jgi:hypothetical protein